MSPTLERFILRCNLFTDRYSVVEFGSTRHRDLVRIFMAGAIEGLIVGGDWATALLLIDELKCIAGEDWLPGEEFKTQKMGAST